MASRRGLVALAGAAVGVGAGFVAQRSVINRRRRDDPEAGEAFGTRRGERARTFDLADGARIFVEEAGPRSTKGAVFVHGSVLRTDVWHYQLAGLGRHRLVFCDLRGHGQSQPRGEAAYSLTTLADDLEAVIDEAGLKEVVIVGHSVGGMIALQLCKEKPELLGTKIKGLALVNTTYGPVTETLVGSSAIARVERLTRRPLDALRSQHVRIERLRKLVRPSDALFWGVALAAFGSHASPKQIDFTYRMLSETPVDVIFDLIKSYRDFDMTDHLGDVTVPALVIGGSHDRITLPNGSQHLADQLPKADLHLLEGCGHMSMLERHREFNSLLQTFLDDTLGPPAKPRRRTTKTR